MKMNVENYLKRIGFTGEVRKDPETLIRLQEHHVMTVPYENLEILARKPLSLDVEDLYEKIVTRGRGGYCFELNGLYAWLLEELGFKVIQHFGRWLRDEPIESPMRRHRILRVPLDGKEYICDVGLGTIAPSSPLVFEFETEQEINGETYRIMPHPTNIYVVEYLSSNGAFKPVYSFNDDPCLPIDYIQAHYYCSNHPDSLFLNCTLIYIVTENGRKTIVDAYDPETGEKIKELRQYENGNLTTTLTKTLIKTDEQFNELLKTHFGFELNS